MQNEILQLVPHTSKSDMPSLWYRRATADIAISEFRLGVFHCQLL